MDRSDKHKACLRRNVRSMIGESTDFTSQAVAFGYLGLAFGVGTVLGEYPHAFACA